MKFYTVYVSRTGHTERVARTVFEALSGDIELITEPVNRKGIIGWMRSGGQNSRREVAEINITQYNPGDYDLVVMASPVWAGAVSAPMRGYMTQNAEKLVKTAVFLSNDSGNVEDAFVEIRELLPNWPLVEGALQRSKIKANFDQIVTAFIEEISSKTSS